MSDPFPQEPATAPDAAHVDALTDLLATLSLYVGHHTWTQLTTEQKELFADVLDAEHARWDTEDGYTGTDMAHAPVERWWRVTAPLT